MPRRSGHPGVRRWSPEEGGEGLRRVHLLRPLVRRKATIKSTRMTWYSLLVKPERKVKEQRSFLINNKGNQQTASQSTNPPTASQSTCPQVRASRAARYWMPRHPRTCRAIRDCKSHRKRARDKSRLKNYCFFPAVVLYYTQLIIDKMPYISA